MRLLFFVRTEDPSILRLVGFYRDDLRAAADLGFEVVPITRVKDLVRARGDVVFAWWFGFGFFAVLWARLRGKPVVLTGTVHGAAGGGLEAWPWHKRVLMRMALRLATRTLFISVTDFERLGTTRAAAPSITYCAVDLEMHQPRDVAVEKTVIAISHLTSENVRRKMILESLEAFALFHRRFPEYRFMLIGAHGAALALIRGKIAQLGLNAAVELAGRVSLEQKIAMLQSATAYLQPSRCEGFGLALLEAEACGCPVVTNREKCIVEINGEAVLYADSPEQMAAQLEALATDPALRARIRELGLRNAQRFSYAQRRDELRKIFVSLGVLRATT